MNSVINQVSSYLFSFLEKRRVSIRRNFISIALFLVCLIIYLESEHFSSNATNFNRFDQKTDVLLQMYYYQLHYGSFSRPNTIVRRQLNWLSYVYRFHYTVVAITWFQVNGPFAYIKWSYDKEKDAISIGRWRRSTSNRLKKEIIKNKIFIFWYLSATFFISYSLFLWMIVASSE